MIGRKCQAVRLRALKPFPAAIVVGAQIQSVVRLVFHIDHWNLADAHAPQHHFATDHFLAGHYAGGGIAHPRRL
ncbi:hypothetical protein D3C80_2002780 [compost metagenome]